nr:hypothetical protein [uncultured Sulfurimonas sp.]
MFSKILGKIKNSSDEENEEQKNLVEKISKMNLTDMRIYVNNKIPNFQVCEDGLIEILNKLLEVDAKTSKRYIDISDNDSKIKKCFDLVLIILTNKKITITAIELVNQFIENSKEIIQKFDQENKQIYSSKFKNHMDLALNNINTRSEMQRKMGVIGN